MRGFEAWLLSYLLNSVWQAPLLFAAGWLAARVLRRAGAAAEHRVWVAVLLLESLLPALSTVRWEVRWEWLSNVVLALLGRGLDVDKAQVVVAMGSGTTVGDPGAAAPLLVVALAYGAAILYFAARFAWRWRKLRALRRDAVEVKLTDEAAACWTRCGERFGIEGASVAASSSIFGPVTIGLRKKLVLFPTEMLSSLPDAELHTVMTHEFAHMRRNDFAKNLIYELLSLPVSYHPVFWHTRERVMESREIVCDAMAAEMSGRGHYARSLLRLASLLVDGVPVRTPQAIGIFDTRTFERRLMRLTMRQCEIQDARRVAAVVACVAFGVAACGSALAMRMHVDAGVAAVQSHPAKAPKSINVPPGVIAGNRIGGENPKYPAEAKKEKIQGKVLLKALIGKDGSIKELTVVSGPKELRESALDAVRTWKYKPFLLNGDPVEVTTEISVVYSLGQ